MIQLRKQYLSLLVVMALAVPGHAIAQKDLHIDKVFEQYGKKRGVVMVQLTGEILRTYNFSFFKSIVIKNDPGAVAFTRDCVAKDREEAKKIKEVVQDGEVTSIVLQLSSHGNENRLILYNESAEERKEMTLIYIESSMDVEDIMSTILTKKE
ncbi:MAG: DUF6108 family protein [Tannerella sp.]|jgi:hypothetical protein|nr:DUF6108 family protein [Tannerella sp.]